MTTSLRTAALLILTGTALAAQETEGVDELFARARRLAFQGKRAEALDLCRLALQRSPDYHDIRILAGRIHTWDGKAWSYTSEWYTSDQKMLAPMIKAASAKYAAEKKITPRDCSKPD